MTQNDTASGRSSAPRAGERAFVLGLDGVPWGMVREWVDDGELPAFARLFEDGAAGPLESTTPASTPLAWPSIGTGTWPDKHGIYWFQQLRTDGTHQMHTGEDVDEPALWDLVSPAAVGNVPMTYPASEIDGAQAAGMMTPKLDERWASPASLRERVDSEVSEYQIGLDWEAYSDRPDEFRSELESLVDARRQLMRIMLEEVPDWRLFFFVYTAPDRLQHLIWEDDALLEHYRQLDDVLAEVLDRVDDAGATLFVVSDHGFGPVEKTVSLPRALERHGFLRREEATGGQSTLASVGLTKDTVRSWLDTAGLDDRTLMDYLPQSVVDAVAHHVPGDHALYDIDRERTVAFAHGSGNVYVNDTDRFTNGCVDPENVAEVKREVADALEQVTDPETGERALVVHDGDELFPNDDASPDLVVKGEDGYEVVTSFRDETFDASTAMQASHRKDGVFFAWGDGVEAGATPDDATVVDVAPTLLHAIGERVRPEMDGRVLEEIFADGSDPAERSVQYGAEDGTAGDAGEPTADDPEDDPSFDEVEERLRGLGYME